MMMSRTRRLQFQMAAPVVESRRPARAEPKSVRAPEPVSADAAASSTGSAGGEPRPRTSRRRRSRGGRGGGRSRPAVATAAVAVAGRTVPGWSSRGRSVRSRSIRPETGGCWGRRRLKLRRLRRAPARERWSWRSGCRDRARVHGSSGTTFIRFRAICCANFFSTTRRSSAFRIWSFPTCDRC